MLVRPHDFQSTVLVKAFKLYWHFKWGADKRLGFRFLIPGLALLPKILDSILPAVLSSGWVSC